MRKSFLQIVLVSIACHSCGEQKTHIELDLPATDSAIVIPVENVTNPFDDSLKAYFDFPVDFYSLKKKTMHMHSGSAADFEAKHFHAVADSEAQFYSYWAVEFDLKNPAKRSLLFATWKPWKTKQQRSYENDNETLVGIQSGIAWDQLGPSDFVGKPISEIELKFGPADTVKKDCSIYFREDQVLILHTRKNSVDWFKYFWLRDPLADADSLPEEFLIWKND